MKSKIVSRSPWLSSDLFFDYYARNTGLDRENWSCYRPLHDLFTLPQHYVEHRIRFVIYGSPVQGFTYKVRRIPDTDWRITVETAYGTIGYSLFYSLVKFIEASYRPANAKLSTKLRHKFVHVGVEYKVVEEG